MGGGLGRLVARTLPGRQRLGAASSRFAFPGRERRPRPDLPPHRAARPLGRRTRLRFSNVFGAQAVTFDGVFAGLQRSGGAVVPGTNQPFASAGKQRDHRAGRRRCGAMRLRCPSSTRPGNRPGGPQAGRKLSRSRRERPHDVARQGADHVLPHRARAPARRGSVEDESAFPFTTTSWYFLDAVDMMAPADTRVVVASAIPSPTAQPRR